MADLGKLRPAGHIRPFAPLCPAHLMQINNILNQTRMSFFIFSLKFENLLLFFNVCRDLYTIISHNIIQTLLERAIPAIQFKELYNRSRNVHSGGKWGAKPQIVENLRYILLLKGGFSDIFEAVALKILWGQLLQFPINSLCLLSL